MDKFFALDAGTGKLVYLGEFNSFEGADLYAEKIGVDCVWLVCDEAKQWQEVLNKELGV